MSFLVLRDFFSLKSKQPSPRLNRLRLTALRLRYVHLLDSVGEKGVGTWRSSQTSRNKVTKLL